MKISSASKKVLASALSAAMVVAFAPTVAFGAPSAGAVTGTYTTQSGAVATATYANIETAINAAINIAANGTDKMLPPTATTAGTGEVISYNYNYAPGISTITLQDDVVVTQDIVLTAAAAGITIDLNGNSITASDTATLTNGIIDNGGNLKIIGEGTVATKTSKPAINTTGILTIAGGKVVAEGTDDMVAVNGNVTVAGGEVSAIAKDDKVATTAGTAKAVNGQLVMSAGKVSAENKDVATVVSDKALAYGATSAGKISGGEVAALVSEKTATGTAIAITGAVSNMTGGSASAENKGDGQAMGLYGSVTKDVAGTVSAKANKGNATAIGYYAGSVIGGSVTGTVSAESTEANAVAIKAAINSTQTTDSVNATVTAKALNDDQSATIFDGAITPVVKGGAYTATAGEDTAAAPANLATIFGSTVVNVTGGTFTAVGGSDTNTKIFTVAPTGNAKGAKVTGGTFTGEIGAAGQYIQGGTWIAKPKAFMNTNTYGYVDDNETYTVYTKYKTLSADSITELNKVVTTASRAEDQVAVQEAATDIFDAICQDGATSVKGLVFVGDATIQTVKDHLLSGDIELAVKTKAYKKALATAEQKAVQDAFDAFAKADNSIAADYTDFKVVLQYTPKGATEAVEIAYITDLGTGERGKARTITLKGVGSKANIAGQYYAQYVNGSVAKAELSTKDGSVSTGTIAPYAVLTVSGTAINDDVAPVEPETPAVEKATQSIEVAKKSMTVKVGSKKKTSKAKAFNIGATAETAVTASKKSGSSKISVSESGKVKLAKGAVKGKTYTAKVTLKAAGSDAYLAAAKTITVKFVIK